MAKLNGKSLLLDKLAITSVCTDACRIGAGGYYQDDWFYANWAVDFPLTLQRCDIETRQQCCPEPEYYWCLTCLDKRKDKAAQDI
jgi:hypothetical protein